METLGLALLLVAGIAFAAALVLARAPAAGVMPGSPERQTAPRQPKGAEPPAAALRAEMNLARNTMALLRDDIADLEALRRQNRRRRRKS